MGRAHPVCRTLGRREPLACADARQSAWLSPTRSCSQDLASSVCVMRRPGSAERVCDSVTFNTLSGGDQARLRPGVCWSPRSGGATWPRP